MRPLPQWHKSIKAEVKSHVHLAKKTFLLHLLKLRLHRSHSSSSSSSTLSQQSEIYDSSNLDDKFFFPLTQNGRIKVLFFEPKFDPKRKEQKNNRTFILLFFVWKINNKTWFCAAKKQTQYFWCASRPVNWSSLKNQKIIKIYFKRKEKKTDLYSTGPLFYHFGHIFFLINRTK